MKSSTQDACDPRRACARYLVSALEALVAYRTRLTRRMVVSAIDKSPAFAGQRGDKDRKLTVCATG